MNLLSTVVCDLKYVDFLLKIKFSYNLLCVWFSLPQLFPDPSTSSLPKSSHILTLSLVREQSGTLKIIAQKNHHERKFPPSYY